MREIERGRGKMVRRGRVGRVRCKEKTLVGDDRKGQGRWRMEGKNGMFEE